MRFKTGIKLTGLRPELILGIMAADQAYQQAGHDMVITSVCDGNHSMTSLHYAGCAVDLRTRDIENPGAIVDQIKYRLGADFDVILESDHIHLEWQPRR